MSPKERDRMMQLHLAQARELGIEDDLIKLRDEAGILGGRDEATEVFATEEGAETSDTGEKRR